MKFKKTYIIPNRENIKSSLEISQKYGCSFEYNDFFMPNVLDDIDLVRERVSFYKELKELPKDCTMHGAFLDVTIFSDDKLIREISRERVRQSMDIAGELGAKGVVFHTNFVPNFKLQSYMDSWVLRNVEFWEEILKEYSETEVYIENMFDADPILLSELGEAMKHNSRFGVCFDYAHANVFGDEKDIDNWVSSLAPYVKHMHINDNDFVSDLHLACGTGKIDWNKFAKYYSTCFNEATVLIETTGEEKILKSLEYLEKIQI